MACPFPERWKPKAGLENFSPIKRRYPTQPRFRSMWRKWLEVAAWTLAFLLSAGGNLITPSRSTTLRIPSVRA